MAKSSIAAELSATIAGRESSRLLSSYLEAIDQLAIVATTDRSGIITSANDRFCATSKYSRDELVGRRHSILNSGHHPREFFVEMWRTIGSGRAWRGEICNRAKDGSRYWVDTTIVPQSNDRGRSVGYVSIRYDVTKRKEAEAEIAAENVKRTRAERLLREIIDAVPNGVVAFDENDGLALFNSTYADLYRTLDGELKPGTSFADLLRCAVERDQFALRKLDAASKESWIQSRLHLHSSPGRKLIQHLSDGRWLQVQERYSPSGYRVSVQTDITGLKLAEGKIKHQAERDPLTALYNRRVLLAKMTAALAGRRETRQAGALILIDLDGFKATNDTLGHDAGDELLRIIARRLERTMRRADVVARLGGDEFAVLAYGLEPGVNSETVARKLLEAVEEPLVLGDTRIVPSASLGIANFPANATTAAELMRSADLALYEAKERGRRTCVSFRSAMRRRVEQQRVIASDLRVSLRLRRIEVALQPQVSLRRLQHSGFEALVRWRRHGRMVPAPKIVAVAEAAGVMSELGRQVAVKSLVAAAALREAGMTPGTLALNVAADQLRDETFAQWLCDTIDAHKSPRSSVEIEVTEEVVLDRESDRIVSTLHDIHSSGIRIALDDFGTGYASLSHLVQLPIHRIKIDRSFVQGVEFEPQRRMIAKAIIALAHDMGMEVVAEGVETPVQLGILEELNCDYIQGFLISKPLFPAQLPAYFNSRTTLVTRRPSECDREQQLTV